MAERTNRGPDLTFGIDPADVPDGGMLGGHHGDKTVVLVRRGEEIFALGGECTHYGAPLADGIVVGNEVRCPWHHACFDLRSGDALAAPALDPVPCFAVERRDGRVFVGDALEPRPRTAVSDGPESVVIVGAGAAGNAAAETLRREGYAGRITLIGAEPGVPIDRPNLSKEYLAGKAPEEWIPLRDAEFYASRQIELRQGTRAMALDPAARQVTLSDGTTLGYGALLLATGADPVPLAIPGGDRPHVFTLRTQEDSRAIRERAKDISRAVVVGASFIGLEVAAALRTLGVEVDVVAPDPVPLARVLGPRVGEFVQALHEERGVRFHLGHTLRAVEERGVILDDGTSMPADLVVAGIGVRPSLALAERAGLRVDRGVLVDEYLQSSVPGIWAAGDIARFPDPRTGTPTRVEHWVVAERLGQTAARNILGRREPWRGVPFFWSRHYDLSIRYVGHAETWDRADIAGNIAEKDFLIAYREGGRIAAVATVGRDRDSLWAELLLSRDDQPGLDALLTGPLEPRVWADSPYP